ncbi:MAG: OmpA family protein [Gammaproteobacteria bacterium]
MCYRNLILGFIVSLIFPALSLANMVVGPMIERPDRVIVPLPPPAPGLAADLRRDGVQVIQVGDELRIVLSTDRLFRGLSTTEIRPSCMYVLSKVALLLQNYCNYPIVVSGHTDNIGSDRAKFIRSQQQAETIAGYLWSQGVGLNDMRVIGYGDTRPVSNNRTTGGQAENRRIEINIQ